MDLASIKSQEQVLDVFENLFNKYSNLTNLPKFKKRRLSQISNSKSCHDSKNLPEHPSLPCQSSSIRSVEHSEGQVEEHHHAKEQGSFSSGVFSIDSDIDILSNEDDSHFGDHMENRADLENHEKNSLSSEAPSEAGSGVVERSLKEVSFIEDKQDVNGDQDDVLHEGYGKLNDEDVLFMMHKPRLKKRRKKPPWQKRKLDFDDLWVKGQHLQCSHGSDQEEKVTTKLFLERNLRWGKVSLQNYISALRKSRKGRKRLNNSGCRRSPSKKQSVKDNSPEDRSSGTMISNAKLKMKRGKNELLAGIPQKRTSFESEGKRQTKKVDKKTRKGVQQSVELMEDVQDSVSEASDVQDSMSEASDVQDSMSEASQQDFWSRSKSEISTNALQKSRHFSNTPSSTKEKKDKRAVKLQKSNAKMMESNADNPDSKTKGSRLKTKSAKKSTVSGSRKGSSASRDNSSTSKGTSSNDMDSEVTRTKKGNPHRLKQRSKTSSKVAKQESKQKDTSALTLAGSSGSHHCEIEQESSGSQESFINFISLTPRKSRKLSKRKRRAEVKVNTNSASMSDSSDFDGHFRGVSLHPRGSLLMSDFPEWEDEEEEEVEYRPLFGRGKHCGGIWNTIIEESS